MSLESERTVQKLWAMRMADALNEYRRCSEATSQLHRLGIVASPQQLRALEQEQTALANYTRLLRAYTELVVYNIVPPEPHPTLEPGSTKCGDCGAERQLYAFRVPVCLQCDAQPLEERRDRMRTAPPTARIINAGRD